MAHLAECLLLIPKVPGTNPIRCQNLSNNNLELFLAIPRKLNLKSSEIYHFVPAALRAIAWKSPRILSQCSSVFFLRYTRDNTVSAIPELNKETNKHYLVQTIIQYCRKFVLFHDRRQFFKSQNFVSLSPKISFVKNTRFNIMSFFY